MNASIARLRAKVANTRGLRKIRAEAELVEVLAGIDQQEALAIARESAERARKLLHKTRSRGGDAKTYELNLAWILRALAFTLKATLDYDAAFTAVDESIELFGKAGDTSEVLRAYYVRHLLFRDQRRFDSALEVLDKAVNVAALSMDQSLDGALHGARGTLLMLNGRPAEAEAAFQRALEITRRNGDIVTEYVILGDWAHMQENHGRPRAAAGLMDEAIALLRRTNHGGPRNQVHMLWNYYRNLFSTGRELHKADRMLDEAIDTALEAGLTYNYSSMLSEKSLNMGRRGYLDQAIEFAFKALDVYAANDHRAGLAHSYALVALTLRLTPFQTEAADFRQRSAEQFNREMIHELRRDDRLTTGVILLAHSGCTTLDFDKYIRYFREMARHQGNPDTLRSLGERLGLAVLQESRGDTTSAEEAYRSILESMERQGYLLNHMLVGQQLGRLLIHSGQVDEGRAIMRRSIRCAREHANFGRQLEMLTILEESYAPADMPAAEKAELAELRRTILHPAVLTRIELSLQRYVNQRNKTELDARDAELAEAHSRLNALQRTVASRDAHIQHLTQRLQQLAQGLQNLPDQDGADDRLNYLRDMALAAAERQSWNEFEHESSSQDEDFLRTLAERFPRLTNSERKICALIRLNNTTRDLCRLLNISPRSVQVYRYRIRKKLELHSADDLNAYILSL